MHNQHIGQHLWKDAAHVHFQHWAEHYDRDIINILLFMPCHRRVLAQLRHWRRRGLEHIRMLDIGCGTGTLAIHCLEREPGVDSIVGMDMSDNMIDKAQAKVHQLGLADRARFAIGDAEHLPFEDGSFDVITCCNSFHHYPHQDRAVAEMFRVLDRNGKLILIDGYRDNSVGYFIFEICVARAENHVHHCTDKEFQNLLTGAGFTDIKQNIFGICPPAIINVAYTDK